MVLLIRDKFIYFMVSMSVDSVAGEVIMVVFIVMSMRTFLSAFFANLPPVPQVPPDTWFDHRHGDPRSVPIQFVPGHRGCQSSWLWSLDTPVTGQTVGGRTDIYSRCCLDKFVSDKYKQTCFYHQIAKASCSRI